VINPLIEMRAGKVSDPYKLELSVVRISEEARPQTSSIVRSPYKLA
jgi:hypothetical protein